jgi:hypothetical protein
MFEPISKRELYESHPAADRLRHVRRCEVEDDEERYPHEKLKADHSVDALTARLNFKF